MSEQFAGKDKVVSFTYSIIDEFGETLELSDIPVNYVHGGKHDVFEKVEQALEGSIIGDTVEVALTPEEGFGVHDPQLTYTDEMENVPPEFQHVGAEVEMRNDEGDSRKFTVTHIENGRLTVDGNHPLAGKAITFHISVIGIRDATAEELAIGVTPMEKPVLH